MDAPRTVRAIALVAGLFTAVPSRATAQSTDDLAVGRKLFADALADEDKKRFAEALDKYKRVQAIKDTVAVRFRIGASYEGLGKTTRAVDAYSGAVHLGTTNGTDPDIVKAAQARIGVLEPRVAHLSLQMPRDSYPDAEVAIDDEPVAREGLADVRLDPGAHTVTAKASGARPFRSQLKVSEGGRAELPIVFEATSTTPEKPPPEPRSSSSLATIGIVTGIAGGVLAVGGTIALVVRSGDISDLRAACPSDMCPADRENELTSTRDRATTLGPIGATLLIVGGAAVATGVVLYLSADRSGPKTTGRVVPLPGGMALSLTQTF